MNIEENISHRSVGVIIPVYKGVDITRMCIKSAVLGLANSHLNKILVINDASPEPGMFEMLQNIKSEYPEQITVINNESNLGFVKTINIGIKHLTDSDVVLLNSDVIVPNNWLARLKSDAYSKLNIGTVTPLTNNGTICSFPLFLDENNLIYNLSVNEVDSVFRAQTLQCVEAPTGVGFCIYIRRDCINEVGLLDEKRFGRGYGEENDFCQRAIKKGWRNLISPNLFVFHYGSISFSSEKKNLVKSALDIINRLHPNYHRDVANFIKKDELKRARFIRNMQLISVINKPKILFVTSSLGGGVQQHLEELILFYNNKIIPLFLSVDIAENLEFKLHIEPNTDTLSFVEEDYECLLDFLKISCVNYIHFHHTMGFPSWAMNLLKDLKVNWILTVHDYYLLSGNPTLTDDNGCFLGFSETVWDVDCERSYGMKGLEWRKKVQPLVESASHVIFPSYAAKEIFGDLYKIKTSIVAAHIETTRNINKQNSIWISKDKITFGILGALSKAKGCEYLEQIATLSKEFKNPFKFKLIGYTGRYLKNVQVTGRFKHEDLQSFIIKNNIDIIFFPALWPETYSYTLSYALESGLPIIAPDIGAFPERLSGRTNSLIYKQNLEPSLLLHLLKEFIDGLNQKKIINAPVWKGEQSSKIFYDSEYLKIISEDIKTLVNEQAILASNCRDQIWLAKEKKKTFSDYIFEFLSFLYQLRITGLVRPFIPLKYLKKVKKSLTKNKQYRVND
jgi:GT2 family glycosyltransferase/glycosyltransferase involved in cell wall biosynthesis